MLTPTETDVAVDTTYSKHDPLVFKLNPGPTNDDDQSTISTHCSHGRNTSHRMLAYITSIRWHDYDHSYMSANLKNLCFLNCVSQAPDSQFCKNFTSCLLNARSVRNKTLVIKDFVVDHAVVLLGIMETWFHPRREDVTIGELCLGGHHFAHTTRLVRTGESVGLLYR